MTSALPLCQHAQHLLVLSHAASSFQGYWDTAGCGIFVPLPFLLSILLNDVLQYDHYLS